MSQLRLLLEFGPFFDDGDNIADISTFTTRMAAIQSILIQTIPRAVITSGGTLLENGTFIESVEMPYGQSQGCPTRMAEKEVPA